ncbi:MAG: translation initiation factor IF-2 N-terminal domain-containing protein [Phycisphaerae bacterium]|nr:translation initiation factor IF-2 N-terminal domain-containing protein [Phycisphaerae bacterium]
MSDLHADERPDHSSDNEPQEQPTGGDASTGPANDDGKGGRRRRSRRRGGRGRRRDRDGNDEKDPGEAAAPHGGKGGGDEAGNDERDELAETAERAEASDGQDDDGDDAERVAFDVADGPERGPRDEADESDDPDAPDDSDESGDADDSDESGDAEDSAAPEGDDEGEPREGRGERRDRGERRGRRERHRRDDRRDTPTEGERRHIKPVGKQVMLVNDVPGEECRIAVLENGRLEALFIEREGTTTNVGNIYKGRVTNVEPAIQAAFVDFGEGQSGFLHISDLHPKYFPGEERTERVGRKIPRRERPLIQQALRKGQEVVVQVLKEGIGSKGPTLTSYLSIPGRLMVMMPDMDRVGVSRKVDDEDQRRAMRKILDQLDLPEGFGFILRTAGFDRTKTELSRDLAYLKRLWEVMQKRSNSTGAPCMLYSEGDLLIRSIRDMADENVEAIVVDSEEAFRKASAFLSVVAPRNAPTIRFWSKTDANDNASVPLFHAFDVERQIAQLHSREVPLPSGGALVIDQAEALVAIDVNSGRSRSARDSETNAYQTNVEAVEEIARQLRLRDLGGVIINDLIDMRSPKHRRDIEDRFRAALRRDRAKSTTLPITDFGVIEMTRQRMRPSVRKTHFMDCPHCHGLGEVMMPETVAADHLREIEYLCSFDKVRRIEVVCSMRVASVLLSAKRRALYELEASSGRRLDIRISEAIPIDRVDLYAYDERGSDIEIARLPRPSRPSLDAIPTLIPERDEDDDGDEIEAETGGGRRRRRRRRKPAPADTTAMILSGSFADLPSAHPSDDEPTIAEAIEAERASQRSAQEEASRLAREGGDDGEQRGDGEGGRRRRRRRRRGRGRGGDGADGTAATQSTGEPTTDEVEVDEVSAALVEFAPPPPPPPPSEPTLLHLLAKELSVTSKDLLAKCREGGMDVKSHMTKLTGEQVDIIKAWYAPPPPPPPPPTARPARPAPRPTDRGDDDANGDDNGGEAGAGEGEGEGRRRRRRRRRRGRGGNGEGAQTPAGGPPSQPRPPAPQQQQRPQQQQQRPPQDREGNAESGDGERRGRRRRRRGRGGGGGGGEGGGPREPRPRSSGESGGSSSGDARPAPPATPTPPPSAPPSGSSGSAPAPMPRRSLYGGRFRKLGSGGAGERDDE